MSSHRRTETSRVYWLDALRGLAIIAVVMGHINIGLMQAGLTNKDPEFFRALHTLLYLVHMPLFAFLFGLNIPSAWEKRQSWAYAGLRIWLFLYLYLVWTLIQGSFEVFGARFSNGETSWFDVLNIVYPLAHLWYLPWMIVIYTTLILLKPWRSVARAMSSICLFSIISWISWGVDYPEFYRRGIAIAIFAVIGALIGTERVKNLDSVKSALLLPLALTVSIIFVVLISVANHLTIPTLLDAEITLESKILGMLVSCLGIVSLLLWGNLLSRSVRMSFLEVIGTYSLQIYLMHLLFTPTLRILLMKVGVQDPWIIGAVSLIGGVGLPFICATVFYRQTSWIFDLPRGKSYRAKHSTKYNIHQF
ncbi:acyltransferase [Rothia sp. SD9660Na]|uniref:acyltransferase family protein n=1 Tax=Rothia sp. SD9660Na TaxID=3047030 RepID=UPI0024BA591B|nr:acyltransferase [Rothia sp. SD9660Na]WHS50015.1 acyltransferase [Rothia sp. SD9660Na]